MSQRNVELRINKDGTATIRDENNIEQKCYLADEIIKLANLICD